jgi:DNA-binding protein H-NS
MQNLSRMTAEALMDLRKQVDETLLKRRADIEKQLKRMGAVVDGARVVRGGGSALRGKKVPPKYRGPKGETWAGRGVKPHWLVAAIKGGKKIDDFLIDKSERKGQRRSKDDHASTRYAAAIIFGPVTLLRLSPSGGNASQQVLGPNRWL